MPAEDASEDKAHTPTDREIEQDVIRRLDEDQGIDASEITIEVADAKVKLTGTVSSKDELDRAGTIACTASGVRHVENEIQSTSSAYHRWTNKMPGEQEL